MTTAQDNIKNMAPFCYGIAPGRDGWIVVKIIAGERGYRVHTTTEVSLEYAQELMESLNDKIGVSDKMASAMISGSMFGYGTPGADPLR